MARTNQSSASRKPERFRVLLVEPNEDAATTIRRALKESASDDRSFDVSHHSDPEAALADVIGGDAPFDIAMLSGMLPQSSCLEFRKRICEQKASLPVVLSFDAGREREAADALCLGADEVVIKDPDGGYLKLLPDLLAKVVQRADGAASGTLGQLAVIVRSDPESTAYKQAEQRLLDSEPFWRAMVESPFERVLLVDKSGTIQYVNRMEYMEFSDVIGKAAIYDFIPPDQREPIRGKFETVLRDGTTDHYEVYVPQVDRWYTSVIGPVYEGGSVIGASIFSRDITEQKQVENRLKESEGRFRQLAGAIRDVFYILDPVERETVYVSPGYEEVYGRSLESVYTDPMSWMESVHPDDRDQVQKDFSEMMRCKADGYGGNDYRIVKPDGAVRWVQHRAFVIRGEQGEPVQIAGVVTDKTAAQKAENELLESEHKYRTLVNQASDAIFVTNADGYFIDANDAGCEMLGYTRDELSQLNFRDVIPKEDLINDPPQLDDLRKDRLIVKARNLIRKDGSIFAAEGSFKAVPGGRNQAIIRDVTERRRMDDELRRAHHELRKAHDDLERRVEERTRELQATSEAFERSRRLASIGTLAAGIAHEINNPIGSILMAADMALLSLDDPQGTEEVKEALESVKEDAKRAGRIVKTVLQLSRQEVSKKWPQDIGDVARRARDITRRTAEARGVTVELEIEANLPMVVVNPAEIEQAFVNVLSNAIEASQPGESVTVRLNSDDTHVHAVFEDSGHGMDRESVSRVFDPFFSTRQSEGGTGLGLSLTHSIVHLHGGIIDFDSEPGKGTRVTISFLRADLQGGEAVHRGDEG